MPLTNADRQQHGQSAQNGLEQILNCCLEADYIFRIEKNYRAGRDGYNNSTQFYVPFMIHFRDNTKWLVFTTTSMRTDRIKGQQWDASNLKEIDNDITRAFLIYPDGLSQDDKNEFIRQNGKYTNGDEYSAIDGVFSQDQISNLIERYALNDMNAGQVKDRQGNGYESRVSSILKYTENLTKWKTNARTLEGMHYDTFRTIINCLNLDKRSTNSIDATSDKRIIGRLPSGGNPKTDVLVSVTLTDGTVAVYTISCKRSSDRSVSVHQYTADAFADVLNSEDKELSRLLNEFQNCGSLGAFGTYNCIALEDVLAPYLEELSMWVLGGFGGDSNDRQCAKYILTYNNNTGVSSIHDIHDYYKKLIAAGVTGHFGTLFSWTYPSGRRGQSIQLKCRIL